MPHDPYLVFLTASAMREIDRLDGVIFRRIEKRIDALASNPRPSGCVKLVDSTNEWRIRVGDWRIIYTIDDTRHRIDIIGVRHRSVAYD